MNPTIFFSLSPPSSSPPSQPQLAFDYLGNSLTHDPRNARTILAAGSIIQDNQDMDVALVKYRVAAVQVRGCAGG
jgi:Tfp pilus assembly protein PilF